MNTPDPHPLQNRHLETEAEEHAAETVRAVHGELPPGHSQPQQAPAGPRGDEPPNARPHEPWQID